MSFLNHSLSGLGKCVLRNARPVVIQPRRFLSTRPEAQSPVIDNGPSTSTASPSSGPRVEFDGEWQDPRPPWLYTSVKWVTRAVIPGIMFYCVLFQDFGSNDHVFIPVRRWYHERTTELYAQIFTLSSEERAILDAERNRQTQTVAPIIQE